MQNIKTQLVKHSYISLELLERIALLKSIRWSYPVEKQLEWMNDNLKSEDYHLLVYADEKLIAYTNFVNILVNINNIPMPFSGIGNVCTSESGKGYGEYLMNSINEAIIAQNWNGVLLCKDHLVPYYEKYGWKLVGKDAVKSEQLKSINILIFNFGVRIYSFEYNKILF